MAGSVGQFEYTRRTSMMTPRPPLICPQCGRACRRMVPYPEPDHYNVEYHCPQCGQQWLETITNESADDTRLDDEPVEDSTIEDLPVEGPPNIPNYSPRHGR